MTLLDVLNIINFVLGILFVMCYAFQFIYLIIPFVIKVPKHKESVPHKFAILICARNEESVIGTLIDSIKAQDYPAELVTVVVVADNCTDRTAEVARSYGAVVYERFNTEEIGKGYALHFGLSRLDSDFGENAFDAFIVFDADNILTKNYITEINKTYSDGYEVVTCYRNCKNYGDSWLSACAGLWYIRESKYLNGSRFRIGACPQVSGTGFLFSNKIKKENGGWPYHTLTEDYEFTCDSAKRGIKFGYCESARFYDEQVSGFVESWPQRMRWTKGGLQSFARHWRGLLKGVFSKNFLACYDMLMSIAPAYIISLSACIINIVGYIALFATGNGTPSALISPAVMIGSAYAMLFIQGLFPVITEWRHIRAPGYKKILSVLHFPFFFFSFIPICFVALFKRVEWKPTRHSDVDSGAKSDMTSAAEVDELPTNEDSKTDEIISKKE